MATVSLEDDQLVVRLSALEKLGALHGDVRVPRRWIKSVRAADNPFGELRGIRVGTGWPGRIALGRWWRRHGKDFVAVYSGQRGVVVDLTEDAPYERLIVTTPNADALVRELRPRRLFRWGS